MSNTERVRAWEPPTLPAATELGATVEVDGKTYKTVDTYASLDLGWVQLVFESPDGQVVYDPPLERPLPSWRVIIEDELPDVPPLPDPDPEPSEELLVRFTLHAPTEEQGERMSRLRAAHMRLAALV